MQKSLIERTVSLQTQGIEAYRRKHKLTPAVLYATVSKYNLSTFISENYEILHLDGIDKLVSEMEDYMKRVDKC